ncbi:uncharacterized protein LOC142228449 [Haematobia irritans]|uniref:uncharacterized protein LOC142228449 n=1 Tax=Haematobia irritans TaxID=7368 RepID=UPI003F506B85
MEFTDQQKQISKLSERSDKIRLKIEQILKDKEEYVEKNKSLKARLDEVQKNMHKALSEELTLKKQLEAARPDKLENTSDFLNKMCLLLGFQMSGHLLDSDSGGGKNFLCNNYNGTYNEINRLLCELVNIYPSNPEFTAIREFLSGSKDLDGLLTRLKPLFENTSNKNSNI